MDEALGALLARLGGGVGLRYTAERPDERWPAWKLRPLTAVSAGVEPFFGSRFRQRLMAAHYVAGHVTDEIVVDRPDRP